MTSPDSDDTTLRDRVAATLAEHPVRVGFLFGSQARGDFHDKSDVDVAVVFENTAPGEPNHMDKRLALGSDLALALQTDDVDLVDLRSAPSSLIRAAVRDGDRLVGSDVDARQLRDELLADADEDPRSPAKRFDDALSAIDDHLA